MSVRNNHIFKKEKAMYVHGCVRMFVCMFCSCVCVCVFAFALLFVLGRYVAASMIN